MATVAKVLARGNLPASEATGLTVLEGVKTVPNGKHWIAKTVIYVGATGRTVTWGAHASDATLAIGDYHLNAEALASKEKRETGIRIYTSGATFRGSQGTGTDVQFEVIGFEEDN